MRALALVWIALLAGCDNGSARQPGAGGSASSAALREPAPPFELDRLGGGTTSLASLLGKTIVIEFWATWCPPCEFQVPELNAFYEAHRSEGDVEVIGISIDVDGAEVIGPWAEEKGVVYTILMGDEDLARRYGAMGFPTTVVVGRDGTIQSTHTGLIERANLEAALERSRAG